MDFEELKVDPHVHTCYSHDSLLSPRTLFKVCKMGGINCIGVTDHNSITGALKMKRYPLKIIVGEEITTKSGEVIGLFLNECISKNLSLEETVDKIKEQDGLVYIPHPFDTIRKSRLKVKNGYFWRKVDIVEVFNSRVFFNKDNIKAFNLARKLNCAKAYGSDAHTCIEIGNAYNILDNFDSKREFVRNLKKSIQFGRKSSVWVLGYTKLIKLLRKF